MNSYGGRIGCIPKNKPRKGYKFLTWSSKYGIVSNYDHSKWIVGKWRRKRIPILYQCNGFNCSPTPGHAASFITGRILAKVEYHGDFIEDCRKTTSRYMRIVKWVDMGKYYETTLWRHTRRDLDEKFITEGRTDNPGIDEEGEPI